jgi:hypothetical protein
MFPGACHVQRRFCAQPLQDNNPREGRSEVRRTRCPFESGYAEDQEEIRVQTAFLAKNYSLIGTGSESQAAD